MGTYHGVAPEVVACHGAADAFVVGYDNSVDYWGLGVLIYELLTGKMPAWTHRTAVDRSRRDCDLAREVAFEGYGWPDIHAGNIAREAISGRVSKLDQATNVIRLNAISFVGSILSDGSRDTADNHTSSRGTTHNQKEGCWHIEAIDVRFSCGAQTALELLFDSACRHSSSDEVQLCEAAVDLIRCLLTVCPERRLETLKMRSLVGRDDGHRWSSAVRGHPFFKGITSWEAIDCGASPPSLVDCDRRLGFTELITAADDPDELISPENQLLFEGF